MDVRDNLLEESEVAALKGEETLDAKALEGLKLQKPTIISFLALVAVWQIVSFFFPPYLVPGIGTIISDFAQIFTSQDRLHDVLITVARILGGLIAAFIIGWSLAMAMYFSKAVESYVMPLVKFAMGVPALCWVLFSVIWFPTMEIRINFVLLITASPVFLINILDGMRGIPKDLRDMLWSLRPTTKEYITKLILPGSVPAIFTAWKVNIGYATRVVIVAELVGAISAIGYQLLSAQELFELSKVFAWTLTLVASLLVMEGAVSLLESRALKWRD